MNHLLLSISLLCTIVCFGQQSVDESNIYSLSFTSKQNNFGDDSTNINEYFSIDFIEAKLDGFKEKEKLRYNAFLDQFEFLRDNHLYSIPKVQNSVITFNNRNVYKFVSFIFKDNLTQRYLKALTNHDRDIVLYKKYEIDRTKPLGTNTFDKISDIDENGYKYTKEEKLFFFKDGYLIPISTNVKKLSEVLGINVEMLIKENKLNLKKEEDLIKFVDLLSK